VIGRALIGYEGQKKLIRRGVIIVTNNELKRLALQQRQSFL